MLPDKEGATGPVWSHQRIRFVAWNAQSWTTISQMLCRGMLLKMLQNVCSFSIFNSSKFVGEHSFRSYCFMQPIILEHVPLSEWCICTCMFTLQSTMPLYCGVTVMNNSTNTNDYVLKSSITFESFPAFFPLQK